VITYLSHLSKMSSQSPSRPDEPNPPAKDVSYIIMYTTYLDNQVPENLLAHPIKGFSAFSTEHAAIHALGKDISKIKNHIELPPPRTHSFFATPEHIRLDETMKAVREAGEVQKGVHRIHVWWIEVEMKDRKPEALLSSLGDLSDVD
jgi:hypothetical protein